MELKKNFGLVKMMLLGIVTLAVIFGIKTEVRANEYEEFYCGYDGKKTEMTKGNYSHEFYSETKNGNTIGILDIYDKDKTKLLNKISGDMYLSYIGEEKVYYVLNNKLYEMKLSSGKKRMIKVGDKVINMGGVKGNNVYIYKYLGGEADYICDLYKVDLKTGKQTELIKDCSYIRLGDKHIAYFPSAADVTPSPLYICDYSGKNKKTVARFTQSFEFVGEKLYYGACNSLEDSDLTIYSYDINTGKRKAVSKKKISGYPSKFTDSYLEFFDLEGSDMYRLDYSSGKITRIK